MRDVDSYCGKMDIDANQVKKFMIRIIVSMCSKRIPLWKKTKLILAKLVLKMISWFCAALQKRNKFTRDNEQ